MKKKFNTIEILHLILMALMTVATLISIIVIFTGNKTDDFDVFFGSFNYGVFFAGIVNIAALVCGIIYVLKGYSKEAAGYYKAFLALVAVYALITTFTSINQGIVIRIILKVVKIVLLLVLVFVKDLGKKKTWIIFAVMLAVDICVPFIAIDKQHFLGYRLVAHISKFLTDGTIGLAIRGKYIDKDKRGTK